MGSECGYLHVIPTDKDEKRSVNILCHISVLIHTPSRDRQTDLCDSKVKLNNFYCIGRSQSKIKVYRMKQ